MEKNQGEVDAAPFKDYCHVLQLHPDADPEMVDAAYWHLAKRYNAARQTDPKAKEKLDELNEAYSVMRGAEQREEYTKRRAQVLGADALPVAPEPESEPEPLPLAVMEREIGRLTAEEVVPAEPPRRPRLGITGPQLQRALPAVVMVSLAAAALLRWHDVTVLAAILAIGLVVALVPLSRRLPSVLGALGLPKLHVAWSAAAKPAREPHAGHALIGQPPYVEPPSVAAEALREATDAMRTRFRQGSDASPSRKWEGPDPDVLPRIRPASPERNEDAA